MYSTSAVAFAGEPRGILVVQQRQHYRNVIRFCSQVAAPKASRVWLRGRRLAAVLALRFCTAAYLAHAASRPPYTQPLVPLLLAYVGAAFLGGVAAAQAVEGSQQLCGHTAAVPCPTTMQICWFAMLVGSICGTALGLAGISLLG